MSETATKQTTRVGYSRKTCGECGKLSYRLGYQKGSKEGGPKHFSTDYYYCHDCGAIGVVAPHPLVDAEVSLY